MSLTSSANVNMWSYKRTMRPIAAQGLHLSDESSKYQCFHSPLMYLVAESSWKTVELGTRDMSYRVSWKEREGD